MTLVAEEIDNIAGEVNGRLTAINAELSDVDTRLENLYGPLETKQLPIRILWHGKLLPGRHPLGGRSAPKGVPMRVLRVWTAQMPLFPKMCPGPTETGYHRQGILPIAQRECWKQQAGHWLPWILSAWQSRLALQPSMRPAHPGLRQR